MDQGPRRGRNVTKENIAHVTVDVNIPIEHSSWIALRCFENRKDKRPRFAHAAPTWIEVKEKPLRAK